ncbi:hypothetical protein GCHA_0608 [Paraglaciecola chathamensis S18K6]|uniref:Transposase n=1 Tax=Paraglaciecola chathamensis S18K6 TaxID=1127672 RepID=A0AAV3UU61_9ALTE|nr:hypothetical protein GCHA_0608 [Paraglaciecola chathamensis S18K6]
MAVHRTCEKTHEKLRLNWLLYSALIKQAKKIAPKGAIF